MRRLLLALNSSPAHPYSWEGPAGWAGACTAVGQGVLSLQLTTNYCRQSPALLPLLPRPARDNVCYAAAKHVLRVSAVAAPSGRLLLML